MLQGIMAESPDPIYPIGMRFAKDDRVFRYCRAAALLDLPGWAHAWVGLPYYGVTTVENRIAGNMDITFDIAGAPANAYQNGFVTVHTAPAGNERTYAIVSSEAEVAGHVKLHLADPLSIDVPTGQFCVVYPSIYNLVDKIGLTKPHYETAVCLPLIAVQNGYYFWGQTWGPCFFVGTAGVGGAVDNREVYVNPNDGSMVMTQNIPGAITGVALQRAGYLLPMTDAAANETLMMLQFAP